MESVGIYRFLRAFDQYSIKPTFALNTRVAERYPYLIDLLKERGDEIHVMVCIWMPYIMEVRILMKKESKLIFPNKLRELWSGYYWMDQP